MENKNFSLLSHVQACLLGVQIGDAMGMPWEIMTHEILVFDDGEDARAAYKAMNEKGVVSCAVVQHAKMVGTLTLKEAVRFVTNPKNV